MIRRSTWVVLALFVLMLAAAFLIQRSNGEEAAEPTPLPTTQKFLDFDAAVVKSIKIMASDGKELLLSRSEDDLWLIQEPVLDGETDSAKVDSALGVFLSSQVISSPATLPGLDVLNLDKASYTITLERQDGNPVEINVGNATPTGSGYYVLTNQQSQVIIVNQYGIDQVIAFLEQPPLLPTPTAEAENMEDTEETPSP